MGNLASHSADETDNRRAPTSSADLPTERDNHAVLGLGARPDQEHEPAARHNGAQRVAAAKTDGGSVYALHIAPSPTGMRSACLTTTEVRAPSILLREPLASPSNRAEQSRTSQT